MFKVIEDKEKIGHFSIWKPHTWIRILTQFFKNSDIEEDKCYLYEVLFNTGQYINAKDINYQIILSAFLIKINYNR